jgi:hypothetical protein
MGLGWTTTVVRAEQLAGVNYAGAMVLSSSWLLHHEKEENIVELSHGRNWR